MRYFKLATSIFLGLVATGVLHAQVNGNATISGTALGLPLTISTSSQYAGAISSLKWNGKEFVNDWDHGRQFQTNIQSFERYECYNPYEAGSKADGQAPTTSSRLLSLTANGGTLDSTTQMAWYLPNREPVPGHGDYCGDPAQFLPCPPYVGPLSDYKVHKTVTIGFSGLSNVIEYKTESFIPETILKGIVQTTTVLPQEFSSLWTYDIVSKGYRGIRSLGGIDEGVKVLSTADGQFAMAFYSPELLQVYEQNFGTGYHWGIVPPDPFFGNDPNYACAGIGSVVRFDSFNGPGNLYDRQYLVIGSLDQVRSTLSDLHGKFSSLDPDVFNWRDYLAFNHLDSSIHDFKAAEADWLNNGIAAGRVASKTFSAPDYLRLNPDVANAIGTSNYQAAIDHYVNFGRPEGRSTVAKPSAGMQHLLVNTNGSVTGSGENVHGELANQNGGASSAPQSVVDLGRVTETAAGDYVSFAVKSDGSLWMWGSNRYGARGDGSTGGSVVTPVQVPIPAKVMTPTRSGKHSIAIGTGVYAAVDTTGAVWTWGVNWNGRLGDGTTTAHYAPARVRKSNTANDYLSAILSVTAGGGTVAVIDADETMWTWGSGTNGALGSGSTSDSYYPTQVKTMQGTPLNGIVQAACGSSGFCIALARYGAVFGWGSNSFGQLGFAAGGSHSVANFVPVPGFVDSIAAGSAHGLAHSGDGNVYAWGYNGRGQLGLGYSSVSQATPAPMQPGPDNMSSVSDLIAGANFSAMVRNSDRAVFVAGDNQSGQLGVGSFESVHAVPTLSKF